MRKIIFFAAFAAAMSVFAVSCGSGGNNDDSAPFRTLSMAEGISLYRQLVQSDASDSEQPVLLDVRHEEEYESGHIPSAKLLTMETISEENSSELLKSRTRPVFVYCRSGVRSKMAAGKIASYGYKNITDIGGIMSYSGELEK